MNRQEKNSKPRVIKDYDQLSESVIEQIKLVYPKGFSHYLVSFVNKDGETKKALPFETEDYYYLIRMTTVLAEQIIEDDDDFNEEGELKKSVRLDYQEKHEDDDHMAYNANEDNEFDEDDIPSDDDDDDY